MSYKEYRIDPNSRKLGDSTLVYSDCYGFVYSYIGIWNISCGTQRHKYVRLALDIRAPFSPRCIHAAATVDLTEGGVRLVYIDSQ
jgi:hypothetical protein